MGATIATCVVLVFIITTITICVLSLKKKMAAAEQQIKSFCPNARIVVNTGDEVFFVNDEEGTFGFDLSGKMYPLSGIHYVDIAYLYDGVSIRHDNVQGFIEYGVMKKSGGKKLPVQSTKAIKEEVMIPLRKRLNDVLEKNGVTSTHEYCHYGTIWGCDTNSFMFYTTYGSPRVIPFSDLLKVTVEDTTQRPQMRPNYIIHVYVKDDFVGEMEYDIDFLRKDQVFFDLLAMFKGIKDRQ